MPDIEPAPRRQKLRNAIPNLAAHVLLEIDHHIAAEDRLISMLHRPIRHQIELTEGNEPAQFVSDAPRLLALHVRTGNKPSGSLLTADRTECGFSVRALVRSCQDPLVDIRGQDFDIETMRVAH